ncbi:MAG: hypothetical protein GX410_00635 [Elusimicrobia bacterium]|nr:hypothetical protein [Elusimicrobiota bacterium]
MRRILDAIAELAGRLSGKTFQPLAGPRANAPDDAPLSRNFLSFSIPVPGVLSRSGQPTEYEFFWLKEHGWKSVINLRGGVGHKEDADDAKLPGFDALGFKYLRIQMTDADAPTDGQADHFLSFMRDTANHPAHLHCNKGISRTGVLTAVYRYSMQGWPMGRAIREAALFGGLTRVQKLWLREWAARHKPGEYAAVPEPADEA